MGVMNWILNSMESNISKLFAIAKHQKSYGTQLLILMLGKTIMLEFIR